MTGKKAGTGRGRVAFRVSDRFDIQHPHRLCTRIQHGYSWTQIASKQREEEREQGRLTLPRYPYPA